MKQSATIDVLLNQIPRNYSRYIFTIDSILAGVPSFTRCIFNTRCKFQTPSKVPARYKVPALCKAPTCCKAPASCKARCNTQNLLQHLNPLQHPNPGKQHTVWAPIPNMTFLGGSPSPSPLIYRLVIRSV